MRELKLGDVAGLTLTAEPPAFVGTILLWVLLSAVGVWILDLPVSHSIGGGLVAALLFWLSNIVHQLGHAVAARRTGYPMVGIRLGRYLIFGTSVYPADEEALPATVHVHRALGGPAGSLLFALATGAIALVLRPAGGAVWWLALFVCLNNFITFTLGALLPLGFTDGSTLLEWWGRS